MSKTVVLSAVKHALTSISSIIGFCCSATELVFSALLLDWVASSVLHDEKTQKTIEIERIILKNRFILKNLLKKLRVKTLRAALIFVFYIPRSGFAADSSLAISSFAAHLLSPMAVR